MASLTEIIAAVQDVAAGLDGIVNTPQNPQEAIIQLPYAHTFVKTLSVDSGPAGLAKWIVTVQTDVLCARQQLPDDIKKATPYGDSFPNGIWADPTLAGTVDTVNAVRGTFGALIYGSTTYIGFQFEIDFKVERPLTS